MWDANSGAISKQLQSGLKVADGNSRIFSATCAEALCNLLKCEVGIGFLAGTVAISIFRSSVQVPSSFDYFIKASGSSSRKPFVTFCGDSICKDFHALLVDFVPDFRTGLIVFLEPYESLAGCRSHELRQQCRSECSFATPLVGKKRDPEDEDGGFVRIQILDASVG
jgi:hypothetical protein